jgi:hypothetical protein
MEIGHDVFVANQKPSNISFLNVVCQVSECSSHVVLGINPHLNVSHLFNTWYAMSDNTLKLFLLLGTTVFYWSIWLARNKVVFDILMRFLKLYILLSVIYI